MSGLRGFMQHQRRTPAAIIFFLLATVASHAAAQRVVEAAAPSQALGSDPSPPVARIALSADPLAIYLGSYGFSMEYAPSRSQSLWLSPAWAKSGAREGLSLELAWHVWILGRGLDGPFLGPVAGIGTARGAGHPLQVRAGAEVGYQAVWGGLALGLGLGVDYDWRRRGDEVDRGPSLRVRLAFGWAYL